MIQGIRNCYDRDALAGIAEHLRAGHHDDVIVCILGDCRLERGLERLAERLAEVHAHVCQVLYDYSIILGSQFTYGLEFILCQIEPRRIVRTRIYDRGYAAGLQMSLKLRTEFVTTEIIDVERITRNAQNACLGTLYRESGIDEQDSVLALDKVGAQQECREAALHRAHSRDTSEWSHINVKVCLEESGGLLLQFRDTVHVRILRSNAGIQRLLLSLYAHTHRRKSGDTHLKMQKFSLALSFQSLGDRARLADRS